jgi:hypothetical protein
MKYILTSFFVAFGYISQAQELFLVTEPASNVPTNSLCIGIGNFIGNQNVSSEVMYQTTPEITYGVSKNIMLRVNAFLNNNTNDYGFKGANLYTKYRFLSLDDINTHFRMAAFGKISTINAPVFQEAIDLNGNNSGLQLGVVATKLIHKTAFNASLSYEKAWDNSNNYTFPDAFSDSAISYSLSFGQLLSPNLYTSFKQTNINFMLEAIGQTKTESGHSYLDLVPVLQLVVQSNSRIDFAYRKELISSVNRNVSNAFILNYKYTFYNL